MYYKNWRVAYSITCWQQIQITCTCLWVVISDGNGNDNISKRNFLVFVTLPQLFGFAQLGLCWWTLGTNLIKKSGKRNKLPSCDQALKKTQNLVISLIFVVLQDRNEMYQNVKSACTEQFFLLINPIVLWHSCYHHHCISSLSIDEVIHLVTTSQNVAALWA